MSKNRCLLLIGIFTLLLTVLTLFVAYVWPAIDRYGVKHNLQSRVELLAQGTRFWAMQSLHDLQSIAQDNALHAALLDNDDANGSRQAATAHLRKGPCQRLQLISSTGKIITSTMPEDVGRNVSDRPYFKSAMTSNQPILNSIVISKTTGAPMFLCTAPIAHNGKQIGFLLASFNFDLLFSMVVDPTIDLKQEWFFLYSHDGPTVCRPADRPDSVPFVQSQKAQFVGNAKNLFQHEAYGRTFLTATVKEPMTNWIVGLTIPLKQ